MAGGLRYERGRENSKYEWCGAEEAIRRLADLTEK